MLKNMLALLLVLEVIPISIEAEIDPAYYEDNYSRGK